MLRIRIIIRSAFFLSVQLPAFAATLRQAEMGAYYNWELWLESPEVSGEDPISTAERGDEFISRISKEEEYMRIRFITKKQEGKVGWILLWLLGIPIPILLILFLVRGCT